ncbi:Transcriptional regulator [Hoeflea phototrophica DFL-43]|uniref:Transcriptional regulator n=1 Tax=Hoeflea phototrophica (strain DSM 17068 / NCIMB 14078 / DFL-43) TaxID=411684 RepID=A9D0K8_HOEPD|nr:Transcriptional regulator [Hoeflea phototrophica DFL-43]
MDSVRESDQEAVPEAEDRNGRQPAKTRNHADTGTLGKAVSVLDIVASSEEPMRFTDILAVSDQPRGTLHRQLSNLVEEGLLSLNRDHSYSLGLRLLKFAAKAWAGNQFRSIAEPHLRALHNRTGETVHLGVLRGTEVIYLDKVESRQAVRMYSQIGNSSPVFCTGVGKAAMSALGEEALSEVISKISFRRFTEHTLVTPEALRAEIGDIRESGNAYDREEHELGIRCVAAPIYTPDRSFVAGVSVTGPAYRVSTEALQSWAVLVRETAGAIMDDMGPRLGPRP